jgi:hypothetical protein
MYEGLSKEALTAVVAGKNAVLIRMAATAARELVPVNSELQVMKSISSNQSCT